MKKILERDYMRDGPLEVSKPLLSSKIRQQIEEFEICPICLSPYNSEDFETLYEKVPYGSTSASYPVDVGVKCQICGHHQDI